MIDQPVRAFGVHGAYLHLSAERWATVRLFGGQSCALASASSSPLGGNVDSPRPYMGSPLSGYSACRFFDLVCLLGGSEKILERDEAGVEDFGVN